MNSVNMVGSVMRASIDLVDSKGEPGLRESTGKNNYRQERMAYELYSELLGEGLGYEWSTLGGSSREIRGQQRYVAQSQAEEGSLSSGQLPNTLNRPGGSKPSLSLIMQVSFVVRRKGRLVRLNQLGQG